MIGDVSWDANGRPVVEISCPGCNVGLQLPEALFGKTINCPGCQAKIEMPMLKIEVEKKEPAKSLNIKKTESKEKPPVPRAQKPPVPRAQKPVKPPVSKKETPAVDEPKKEQEKSAGLKLKPPGGDKKKPVSFQAKKKKDANLRKTQQVHRDELTGLPNVEKKKDAVKPQATAPKNTASKETSTKAPTKDLPKSVLEAPKAPQTTEKQEVVDPTPTFKQSSTSTAQKFRAINSTTEAAKPSVAPNLKQPIKHHQLSAAKPQGASTETVNGVIRAELPPTRKARMKKPDTPFKLKEPATVSEESPAAKEDNTSTQQISSFEGSAESKGFDKDMSQSWMPANQEDDLDFSQPLAKLAEQKFIFKSLLGAFELECSHDNCYTNTHDASDFLCQYHDGLVQQMIEESGKEYDDIIDELIDIAEAKKEEQPS